MFLFPVRKSFLIFLGALIVAGVSLQIFLPDIIFRLSDFFPTILNDNRVSPSSSLSIEPSKFFFDRPSSHETTFLPPYAVTWEDAPFRYSLIGIKEGVFTAGSGAHMIVDAGGSLEPGEKFYAINLQLKITNQSVGHTCPVLAIRRIAGIEGDLIAPNSRQFWFGDSACLLSNATDDSQEVFFIVRDTDTEFIFTSGGRTPIFFKIVFNNSGDFSATQISSPSNVHIAVPPPSSPPPAATPVSLEWVTPIGPMSVNRGDLVVIEWKPSFKGSVIIQLSEDGAFISTKTFSGVLGKGVFPTNQLLPGSYNLGLRAVGAQGTNTISLIITGAPSMVSAENSELYFDRFGGGDSKPIVNDGVCGADLSIFVADQYHTPLEGKKVILRSSRGGVDMILAKANTTNADGEMGFFVTSQTAGVAQLSAEIDGVSIGQAVILQVFDAQVNKCP